MLGALNLALKVAIVALVLYGANHKHLPQYAGKGMGVGAMVTLAAGQEPNTLTVSVDRARSRRATWLRAAGVVDGALDLQMQRAMSTVRCDPNTLVIVPEPDEMAALMTGEGRTRSVPSLVHAAFAECAKLSSRGRGYRWFLSRSTDPEQPSTSACMIKRERFRSESESTGLKSPEILVAFYDLFFQFGVRATNSNTAPTGSKHLVTAQIERQVLRIVSS